MKKINPILITTEGLFLGTIIFFILLIYVLGDLESKNPRDILDKVKEKLKNIEKILKQI
jgi:hypothetical protein